MAHGTIRRAPALSDEEINERLSRLREASVILPGMQDSRPRTYGGAYFRQFAAPWREMMVREFDLND